MSSHFLYSQACLGIENNSDRLLCCVSGRVIAVSMAPSFGGSAVAVYSG